MPMDGRHSSLRLGLDERAGDRAAARRHPPVLRRFRVSRAPYCLPRDRRAGLAVRAYVPLAASLALAGNVNRRNQSKTECNMRNCRAPRCFHPPPFPAPPFPAFAPLPSLACPHAPPIAFPRAFPLVLHVPLFIPPVPYSRSPRYCQLRRAAALIATPALRRRTASNAHVAPRIQRTRGAHRMGAGWRVAVRPRWATG
jgi:hypothetical protein